MRHLLVLIVSLLINASPAWAAGRELVFVSTDYPPYFASQLPEEGVVSAITRAAFNVAGYEVRLVYRPWARLLKEVEAGSYDGVVAVWYQADRERYLAYSDAVIDTHVGFYGQRTKPIDVSRLADLKGRSIGTVRGYANPPSFEAAGLQKDEAVDDLTNLRKLQAGRLDLVLIDKALANWLVNNDLPGAAKQITWLEPPVLTMPLYIGFARNHLGYQRLLADFNKGLAEIRRNGEYARITKRLPL